MAAPTPSPPRLGPAGRQAHRPTVTSRRGRRQHKAPTAVATPAVSTSSASRESGAYKVSGTMTAPVPAHVVWDVLTDFDNQPDIFSSIVASRVEPDPATGALHIVQTCKWKWFLFGGAFEVRLAVSQADPPTRGRAAAAAPLADGAGPSSSPPSPPPTPGTLVFTLVSSPFLRSFEGTWTVAPCPLSPESGPAVVEHSLAVTPTLAPPAAAGGYVGRLFQKQVGGVLADLGEELGRRAAAKAAAEVTEA